ncbi:MAG TPA: L,D-transpeptidase family protein [Gallionellaceae bacterium]
MARHFAVLLSALLIFPPATRQATAAELLVHKEKRSLTYTDGTVTRDFKVSLGFTPTGPKLEQGDGKTPEGVYYIAHKNPNSSFHLSLGVSYPNVDDAQAGLRAKLISKKEYAAIVQAIRQHRMPPQNTRMGGAIYIHGGGSQSDWTWGCIALNNEDIDFLYQHVKAGDKVTILK